MSWSKRRHFRRDNWAEEVIAAALSTTMSEQQLTSSGGSNEDDEGIVSDESSPSSGDEVGGPSSSSTTMSTLSKEVEKKQQPKSMSTMILNDHSSHTYHNNNNRTNNNGNHPHQGNIVRFLRSLILHKSTKDRTNNRVFGRDLKEHLEETKQEVPTILRVCTKCIEHHGVVDGIYRLSGISSNIRALKLAFEASVANNSCKLVDEKEFDSASPFDVTDPNVRQDVHSVSSLLKLYFRELPDPLCTYRLYDQFLAAAKLPEDLRLSAIREVVKALPKEHYRTLDYLMRHLFLVSQRGGDTGMTAKNLAIVWAPNLLRSQDTITAPIKATSNNNNLKDIALQAVCTEFLIRYCDLLFCNLPTISLNKSFELGILTGHGEEEREIDIDQVIATRQKKKDLTGGTAGPAERPKSLAISTPSQLLSEKEKSCLNTDQYIDVGGGPDALPVKYHTVVQLKRSQSSLLSNSPGSSSPSPLSGLRTKLLGKSSNSSSTREKESCDAGKKKKYSGNQTHTTESFFLKACANGKEVKTSNSATPTSSRGPQEPKSRFLFGKQDVPATEFCESLKPSITSAVLRRSAKSTENIYKVTDQRRSALAALAAVSKNLEDMKKRPHSSSSEASETDVAGEVNDLQLSFEQEEKEMKMMNCCFDDEGSSTSSSSASSTNSSPKKEQISVKANETVDNNNKGSNITTGNKFSLRHRIIRKMSRDSRGAKNKPEEETGSEKPPEEKTESKGKTIERSASSLLRAKVTKVMMKRQKKPKHDHNTSTEAHLKQTKEKLDEIVAENTTVEFKGPEQSTDEMEEASCSREMETIEEEVDLAFDNRTYLGLTFQPGDHNNKESLESQQQDSGFESAMSYVNIVQCGKEVEEPHQQASYENVSYYQNVSTNPSSVLGDKQLSYENVNVKDGNVTKQTTCDTLDEHYQNVDFIPPSRTVLRKQQQNGSDPSYQNMKCGIVSTELSNHTEEQPAENYQNLTFAFPCLTKPEPTQRKSTTKAVLPPPSAGPVECKESPVYENYDFQEEAVYQNMVVSNRGKMLPAAKARGRRRSAPKMIGSAAAAADSATAKMPEDVYAQVKFLRRSVQEVNALVEQEKTVKVKRSSLPAIKPKPVLSNLVAERTKSFDKQQPKNEVQLDKAKSCSNLSPRKTSGNFRALLSRFNAFGQSPSLVREEENRTAQLSTNNGCSKDRLAGETEKQLPKLSLDHKSLPLSSTPSPKDVDKMKKERRTTTSSIIVVDKPVSSKKLVT